MNSLDLTARKVIMSAFLYYSLDAPKLSDQEFDRMCKRCIDNWDKLDPLRKLQLGSKEDLATTGYHIRITQFGVSAAMRWAGIEQHVWWNKDPKYSRKHRVLHWSVGDFRYAE